MLDTRFLNAPTCTVSDKESVECFIWIVDRAREYHRDMQGRSKIRRKGLQGITRAGEWTSDILKDFDKK